MYIASGAMLAADVVTRGAYSVGGGALVLLAIPLLATGLTKSKPVVKRTASGGLGAIVALVAIAMLSNGIGTSSSGSNTPTRPPSHRTVVTPPTHKPATHKPAAPRPAPHNNGNTTNNNSCAGKIICFHN